MRERGFAVCVAKAVSMATPFYVLRTFQWLRRFNGCAVSRCAVSMASLFLASLFLASPFLAALFLAALFLASLFLASLFLWLRCFSLRCFSLRCFYGFAVLCASHVSMASPFQCLRRLSLCCFCCCVVACRDITI